MIYLLKILPSIRGNRYAVVQTHWRGQARSFDSFFSSVARRVSLFALWLRDHDDGDGNGGCRQGSTSPQTQ